MYHIRIMNIMHCALTMQRGRKSEPTYNLSIIHIIRAYRVETQSFGTKKSSRKIYGRWRRRAMFLRAKQQSSLSHSFSVHFVSHLFLSLCSCVHHDNSSQFDGRQDLFGVSIQNGYVLCIVIAVHINKSLKI